MNSYEKGFLDASHALNDIVHKIEGETSINISVEVEIINNKLEHLKEGIEEVREELRIRAERVAELESELEEAKEVSGGFEVPDKFDDNLDWLHKAVVSNNLHDQLKLKAFANLYRNLSLEEIEAIDDQKRMEYKLKRKTYITHV